MSAEQLAALVGIIVSLVMSYVPGFSDWFEQQTGNFKRLFMLGVGLVVVAAAFGLSCARLLTAFACSFPGAVDAFLVLLAYAIANQTTYALTPRKSKA